MLQVHRKLLLNSKLRIISANNIYHREGPQTRPVGSVHAQLH